MQYAIVQKKNRNAVHAYCYSKESAQRWLDNNRKRFDAGINIYMDKTLTADDFEMIERK